MNRHTILPMLLATALLSAGPAVAQIVETRIAILPVRAHDLPRSKAEVLADSLATAADELFSHRIIGPAEAREIFSASQNKLAANCDNAFCWTKLGKAVDADYLLAVSATGVNQQVLLSVKLVDVEGNEIVARDQQTIKNDLLVYLDGAKQVINAVASEIPSRPKEPASASKASPKPAKEMAKPASKPTPKPSPTPRPSPAPKPSKAEGAAAAREPGYIGLKHRTCDLELGKKVGLESPSGSYVEKTKSGGPADKGGLKAGDVILKFNGRTVADARSLQSFLNLAGAGAPVKLTVWRKGREQDLTVVLGSRPVRRK